VERRDLLGHRRLLSGSAEKVDVDGRPQLVAMLEAMELNHEPADQRPLALWSQSLRELERESPEVLSHASERIDVDHRGRLDCDHGLPPSLQDGPAAPLDVAQGGSPRGSRAGVAFFGEVESDGRGGRDRSTTEFQARPDVDRDDPEPDVAGDIGGRKSMLGNKGLKLGVRDVPVSFSSGQEPGLDRPRGAYSRGEKSFILEHVRDLSGMCFVSADLGPTSEPWLKPLQTLQGESLLQPGPVNRIERKHLLA